MVKGVSYKGDSNFNLFTVGRCLINGWKLSGDVDHIVVSKGGIEIKFDVVIWRRKEALFCCMMKRGAGFTLKSAAAATEGSKCVSMTKAHLLLGHTYYHTAVNTTKYFGLGKLEDSCKVCQPCTTVKSK